MVEGCFGGYVDDCAASLLQHHGHDGLAQDEAGAQIQRQHAVECLQSGRPQRCSPCIGSDGVHQNVDASVLGDDLLHALESCPGVGHVELAKSQGRGAVPGSSLESDERFALPRRHDDAGALVEEGEADGSTQAACSSSDEDDFACESVCHGFIPSAIRRKFYVIGRGEPANRTAMGELFPICTSGSI
jgi:hypothetical protein